MVQAHGLLVDDESRCVHYHSDKDIVALQCYECQKYFAWMIHRVSSNFSLEFLSSFSPFSVASKLVMHSLTEYVHYFLPVRNAFRAGHIRRVPARNPLR